jgi:3-hydroxyisobutyrate dehydrogenase
MLPSTPQVESVYLGDKGLLAGLKNVQGESLTDALAASPWLLGDGDAASAAKPPATQAHTLFVDHTSLDPTAAKRIADTVHEQNKEVLMVDGPVSGGE